MYQLLVCGHTEMLIKAKYTHKLAALTYATLVLVALAHMPSTRTAWALDQDLDSQCMMAWNKSWAQSMIVMSTWCVLARI